MLKLLIKVAIAALLANAVFRVGTEYLTYLKFRDSIRDAAMFKARDDAELKKRIMDLAGDFDIPLADETVAIQRDGRNVSVQGSYEKSIEVVPTFRYPWAFSWDIVVITSDLLPPPNPGTD